MKGIIKYDPKNQLIDIDLKNNKNIYPLLTINVKALLFLIIVLATIVIISCEKGNSDTNTKYAIGKVIDLSNLDGCGLAIELMDGTIINPISIKDENRLVVGDTISFIYTEDKETSNICMADINANIELIYSDCLPLISGLDSSFVITRDTFEISNIIINNNCLEITAQYSGGCKEHIFYGIKTESICGTPPVSQINIMIDHNSNKDMCEAYATEVKKFDLITLQNPDSSSTTFTLTTSLNDNIIKTLIYSY